MIATPIEPTVQPMAMDRHTSDTKIIVSILGVEQVVKSSSSNTKISQTVTPYIGTIAPNSSATHPVHLCRTMRL